MKKYGDIYNSDTVSRFLNNPVISYLNYPENFNKLVLISLFILLMMPLESCKKTIISTDCVDLITIDWMHGDIPELSYTEHSEFPAPNFNMFDINGKYHNLHDYKGKWIILSFWNSKSIWCLEDFEALRALTNEYNEKIVLLAINCLDDQTTWNEIVRKNDLPELQLYCPPESKLMNIYDIEVFPSKYLINPDGSIVYAYPGSGATFYEVLQLFIND